MQNKKESDSMLKAVGEGLIKNRRNCYIPFIVFVIVSNSLKKNLETSSIMPLSGLKNVFLGSLGGPVG